MSTSLRPRGLPTKVVTALLSPVISLLAVSAASSVAHADALVNTPFVFQLNDSFFNANEFDITSKLAGAKTFTLEDTVIQDIAPVNVHGISGSVSYAMTSSTPQVYLGAEITVASSQFTVNLLIQELSVDAIVKTISGTTEVDSHVKGSCTAIPLTLNQGQGQMVGTVKVGVDSNGLPTVSVPWFEAQWAPGSWTVGDFACTGVAGFKDLVSKGLVNYLNDTSQFNSKLKALVDQQAADYQTQVQQEFVSPRPYALGVNGLTMTLTPQLIQKLNGELFQVVGQLGFDFASTKVKTTTQVKASAAAPAALPVFGLALPQEAELALNAAASATSFYHYKSSGEAISGFKSLLASGVQDFFVWPELQYYPSNANFIFHFFAASDIGLTAITDNADGTLTQTLGVTLDTQAYAPVNNTSMLMTTFESYIVAKSTLAAKKTSTGSQISITFPQVQMQSLTATWAPAYATSVMRNSYVNTDLLSTNVASALQSDVLTYNVSPMALTSNLSLTPASFHKRGTWLQINWQ